jgi:hypothetical protein
MPGGPEDRPWPILQDYPAAMAEIGDRYNYPVYSIGSLTEDGAINSLSQWNDYRGMLTFVGSTERCRGLGYVGGDIIQTTLGEVLAWAFRRDGRFIFDGQFWVSFDLWPAYESEMYRIRKWGASQFSQEQAEAMITAKIKEAMHNLFAIAGTSQEQTVPLSEVGADQNVPPKGKG